MDLSRPGCTGDLKILAMRALDAGSTTDEIARKYNLSRKLLERWRGEWRQRRIHLVTSLHDGMNLVTKNSSPGRSDEGRREGRSANGGRQARRNYPTC
jgi:transposase-like protein